MNIQLVNLSTGETEELPELPTSQQALFPERPKAPELYILRPGSKSSTGRAALLLPGGGFSKVALGPALDTARWLTSHGLTCAVLQYRLPDGDPARPLADVGGAWAYLKEHAESLGIAKSKLGMIGFSAGGQLAANWSTLHAAEPELRPAFNVLFYPVTNLFDPALLAVTKRFLGQNPDEAELDKYSPQGHISAQTPPTLLLLSDDDKTVPPRHGALYYSTLKEHGVSGALHVFPTGGHSWSLGEGLGAEQEFEHVPEARAVLADWLKRLD